MILSHKQIEEIAAAVTKGFNEFFFGKDADIGRTTVRATPIDQFARDYLGLSVSFARLSTDGSLCGLTAYTDTEYTVEEQGVRRTIPLKANQVLLDASFIQPGQVHALCGKRRFTLAHECAHQILFGMESDEVKRAQEKRYAPRIAYSLRDLKTREDWNEWQANVLGAAILIRVVDRLLERRPAASYAIILGFSLGSMAAVLSPVPWAQMPVTVLCLLLGLALGYGLSRLPQGTE